MPLNRLSRNALFVAAARMTTGLGALTAPALVMGALLPAAALAQSADTPDAIILRTGRTINGKVLEETETRLKFLVVTGGIKAERWFDKSEILTIQRGAQAPASGAPEVKAEKTAADPVKRQVPTDASKAYVVNLKGRFGIDITQTPIREAIKDAKRHSPDFLIFVLDNDWSESGKGDDREQMADDTAAAHELFRAEEICPVFSEVTDQWTTEGGTGEPPKIIFWIKQAMGGSAILPLSCENIYFSSDGRLGGLGNLSLQLGSRGDEVTRQKLYSAYMSNVESWAVKGGYDYRLIRAICRFEYVLSYAWEGGRPVYLERMPEKAGEMLLTDDGDGQKGNADTLQDRVRGTGNDVLTLNADLARRLEFSDGTVDSVEDLLFALGISRNGTVVPGRSADIMKGWTRNVADAKRDLRRLWDDYGEIQVGGDYGERSKARGQQRSKLKEMLQIIKRYGESLDGQFYNEFGIPNEQQLTDLLAEIDLQQKADRR